MEALYTKDEVVRFLVAFHKEHYGGKISKIKLQKGLYFLYAYYSQFIYRGVDSELGEDFPSHLPRELFTPDFQAWSYGPVDYSVYKKYKTYTENEFPFDFDEFFKKPKSEFVSDYLDTLTRQIFNSTDFGLVELSHQDECWSNNYNQHDEQHRNPISSEEILGEYEF